MRSYVSQLSLLFVLQVLLWRWCSENCSYSEKFLSQDLDKFAHVGKFQGDTKMLCVNFRNFHFFDYMVVGNFKFCPKTQFFAILKFQTVIKLKRMKISKIPAEHFLSPWNLPTWTNLARSGFWFSLSTSFYAKNYHFFPTFHNTAFTKVLVKQKVGIIERHLTAL